MLEAGLSVSRRPVLPAEVGGEILDVDLHPGAVGGDQLNRHPPFFPDQVGVFAVGDKRDLDDLLLCCASVLGNDE